jgi:hypothetical protein
MDNSTTLTVTGGGMGGGMNERMWLVTVLIAKVAPITLAIPQPKSKDIRKAYIEGEDYGVGG